MKKLLLLLVSVVSFALLNAGGLNVSAGLTFPSFSREWITFHGTAGFNGGVSIPYNSAGSVLIEPGIRFRNMRFYWEDVDKWENYKEIYATTININYIDFFIKAKLNPLQNVETNVKIYPNIGFGLGIFSGGKEKWEYKVIDNGKTVHKVTDTTNFEDCNSTVFSILIGMDLLINNSVTLGFEYNRALNSIFKDYTLRSSTIMVNLGYLIPL